MITTPVLLFLFNLVVSCEMNHRLSDLELELHYGTYPSDSFPDDPRHQPERWWEFCGRIDASKKNFESVEYDGDGAY